MNPILRNILAVVVGVVLCMLLNGLLLGVLMQLIGTPDGFSPNDPGTFVLLGPKHYAAPFLAHSVPSLVGALLASLLAATATVPWRWWSASYTCWAVSPLPS